MKMLAGVALVCAVCIACSTAPADFYELVPPDPDLEDLAHEKYYEWGIDRPWALTEGDQPVSVVGASLSFSGIRNWDESSNVLYLHLLDEAPLGITVKDDELDDGDDLEGSGVLLTILVNLPPTPQDVTYDFTDEQIAALNDYAADGRFAIAADPDCHFFNIGAELNVVTEALPEPGTMMLLLVGTGLSLLRYHQRRARREPRNATRAGRR